MIKTNPQVKFEWEELGPCFEVAVPKSAYRFSSAGKKQRGYVTKTCSDLHIASSRSIHLTPLS